MFKFLKTKIQDPSVYYHEPAGEKSESVALKALRDEAGSESGMCSSSIIPLVPFGTFPILIVVPFNLDDLLWCI